MSEWKARRFWDAAQVVALEDGFTVHLDARPLRTPAKGALVVPTQALARAIAAEWDAQDEVIAPHSMPFTRSANAALDKVRPQHAEVAAMIAEYGDTDLLCYRATAPEALARRQAEAWDPLLDWAGAALGARLAPVAGVMHCPQQAAALARLRAQVAAQDIFALTALHDLVSLSGSLVIGLAAQAHQAPLADLWALSRLDESWQEAQWGRDAEAAAAAEIKRAAFLHAGRLHDLSRPGAGSAAPGQGAGSAV